jgi:hypothetical protein
MAAILTLPFDSNALIPAVTKPWRDPVAREPLGHCPAVYLFDRSWRAVSGSDVEHKFFLVARIVEMYELLQALDVAVVKRMPLVGGSAM